MERLSLKLVKSIRYYYLPNKSVIVTAQIIQEIIAKITGFAEGNTPYTVLANLKKKEEKDWTSTSIFGSFLGKLGKGKGYILVENLTQVDNPNQTFKVFKERAFDKKIHTLLDTSNILGSSSGRENLKLEWVSWITRDYNLCSQSKSSEVIKTPVSKLRKRKVSRPAVLPPVVSVIPMNQPLTPDRDGC